VTIKQLFMYWGFIFISQLKSLIEDQMPYYEILHIDHYNETKQSLIWFIMFDLLCYCIYICTCIWIWIHVQICMVQLEECNKPTIKDSINFIFKFRPTLEPTPCYTWCINVKINIGCLRTHDFTLILYIWFI